LAQIVTPAEAGAQRRGPDPGVRRDDATGRGDSAPVELEVVIEIPRWSFLKRGTSGHIDFVSPLPCPFNYGSVRRFIGSDEDYLDAIVLGPRLQRGTRVSVHAYGAIGLTDRDMYDDKLVCSRGPLRPRDRRLVLAYMTLYGWLKRLLNFLRGRSGRTVCEGWTDAQDAILRARPCDEGASAKPAVPF
jgi:inorganic pyrophosphatase